MLDKERILAKVDELESYLKELSEVKPRTYGEYENSIQKKRSCERLLQISIECVIDVCALIGRGLSIGLPPDEDDLLDRLGKKKIFSRNIVRKLKQMKSFRNILVHRYGTIDDELVFKVLMEQVGDFEEFKRQVTSNLNNKRR